jgi:hypothetical protein
MKQKFKLNLQQWKPNHNTPTQIKLESLTKVKKNCRPIWYKASYADQAMTREHENWRPAVEIKLTREQ